MPGSMCVMCDIFVIKGPFARSMMCPNALCPRTSCILLPTSLFVLQRRRPVHEQTGCDPEQADLKLASAHLIRPCRVQSISRLRQARPPRSRHSTSRSLVSCRLHFPDNSTLSSSRPRPCTALFTTTTIPVTTHDPSPLQPPSDPTLGTPNALSPLDTP